MISRFSFVSSRSGLSSRTSRIIKKSSMRFCLTVIFCAALCAEGAGGLYAQRAPAKIEEYRELIAQGRQGPGLYLDLAVLLKEQGRYQEAAEEIRTVLRQCADKDFLSEAWFLLGELCYLRGEKAEAVSAFKKAAAEAFSRQWLLQVYLGLVYEDSDKDALAEKAYENSLADDKSGIAFYRLAKLCRKNKKYDKAAKYFKGAIDQDSSMRLAYFYLGECLFKCREYEEAYNYFAKTLNFYPGKKKVEEYLAKVKKNLGEKYFAEKKEVLAQAREKKKLLAYRKKSGDIPEVKVGIISEAGEFTFKCGGDFVFQARDKRVRAEKNVFYKVVYKEPGKVAIRDPRRKKLLGFISTPVTIKTGEHPFYILDVASGKGDFWQKDIDLMYKGSLEVDTTAGELRVINIVDLETYLYGVIAAEILSSSPLEALKAQAVAARTIALKNLGRHRNQGFDFCNGTHCQVYRGLTVETAATTRAVDETRGEVMIHGNDPIEAFYHANCGGCLRSDIFGSPPYLFSGKRDFRGERMQPGPFAGEKWLKGFIPYPSYCNPSRRHSYRWQRVYDREDFMFEFGYPLEEVEKITADKKGECCHVDKIDIIRKGKTQSIENDLPVRQYFGNLKSSAFLAELKYPARGDSPEALFIWGAGFGHGAGMCQEGAIAQAQQGFSYQDILKHYYKEIEIRKAY